MEEFTRAVLSPFLIIFSFAFESLAIKVGGRDIAIGIIGGFLAASVGMLATVIVTQVSIHALLKDQANSQKSYKQRVGRLSKSLVQASAEADSLIKEMQSLSQARENALQQAEAKLAELEFRREKIQAQIKSLKGVSLPAIEYFLRVTERGEKRSAYRDYGLFALGVVVSTVITIILKRIFNI